MLMIPPSGGDTFVGNSGITYNSASNVQTQIGSGDVRQALLRNWVQVTAPNSPTTAVVSAKRAQNIAAFLQGAAIAAPAWAATTAVVKGQVMTLPTGQLILATNAATTGASAPVPSKAAPTGRPITDGGVTAYGTPISNPATTVINPPTVSINANAAAAGLTATLLNGGGVPSPLLTAFGGLITAQGFQNSIYPVGFARGTTGGNSNGVGTGAGLSATYTYDVHDNTIEFYITDAVVGLVFNGNTNPQQVEIDGVLMSASPSICTNAANQCIVWDFNGVVKRRQVRVNSWGGTCNPSLTGVALSTIGFIEATDSPNDQMLLLGDSILNSISSPGSVLPISTVGGYLKRYLGLAGVFNCSVGGTGYLTAPANTFNSLSVLLNPVNQTLFAGYNPGHVLIAQGYNDIGVGNAAVAAAALATWQQARVQFPNAKITVTDGFSEATGPSANALSLAAALQTQFDSWGDANSRFIQSIGPSVAGAWMQGIAGAGTALAAGNSYNFIGTDNVHPTILGAQYYGLRLANAITAAWNGNY